MISLGIHTPASPPEPPSTQAAGPPPAPPSPAPAEKLEAVLGPRFRVLGPIATGGMASILQLQHRIHGGLFAAKVLHPELALRPEVVDSFRREAIFAARLGDHPNAIPVFDSGEQEGLHFLLMPFIEGEDLDHLLHQHGPLSPFESLHFAAQISSLLCHAESHGITHCDIAPGNIRLDIFGRYRLMDFGIAYAADGTSGQPLGGTPLYSSPEQLRGEVPDIRADIYAFGLVLAEVLTGKPLLEAPSLDALREAHLHGTWKLPASLLADPALTRLLQRMTALDREQRFSSAFELSGALAAMGFERPEFRPRPGGARAGAPSTRRSRLS